MDGISVGEVKGKLDRGEELHLLDVREADEVATCSLPRAEHIPMLQLFMGLQRPQVGPEAEIIVFCHHGVRSEEAASYLRLQGYENARSMAGGIDAWAAEVDPSMPRY
ncbi:MAG: rhodanese-like domain-containing protein [Planctomycetota bacterium]